MRTFVHPVTGKEICVGGRRPPKIAHHLFLHDPKFGLDLSRWPATPASTNYGELAAARPVLTDILGNDKVGCCTEVDQYKRQALRQAAAGSDVYRATVIDVLGTYGRDGGYVPGQPDTDQGCDETVVLSNAVVYGITNGPGGSVNRAKSFLAIDGSNWDLVRAAANMFVGAAACMGLPEEWIQGFHAGCTWDAPKGPFVPGNGHCFTLVGQAADALPASSWGDDFTITRAAIAAGASAENGGALYIEIDDDLLAKATSLAPDGANWPAIAAAFEDMGGSIPPASGGSPSAARG